MGKSKQQGTFGPIKRHDSKIKIDDGEKAKPIPAFLHRCSSAHMLPRLSFLAAHASHLAGGNMQEGFHAARQLGLVLTWPL